MTDKTNERNRLISLIEFAEQCARMRATPPSSVAKHQFALHEFQIQKLPGVHVTPPESSEGDEVWLRVDRLHETKPPLIKSAHLRPWIEMTLSCESEPTLSSSVPAAALVEAGTHAGSQSLSNSLPVLDPQQRVQLEFYDAKSRVESEFNHYLSKQWSPWAAEEKARRSTISLYSTLFMLKQQLEGGIVDAPIEMVWGAGMMLWKHAAGELSYPPLTTQVDLSLDLDTAAIEVRPRDAAPRLEADWFTAHDISSIAAVERDVREFFALPDASFSPMDRGTFESLLRSAVTHLDPAGQYIPDTSRPEDRSLPRAEQNLKVTDTWVLFARPRTNSEYIRDLERIRKLIADGQETLPGAVRAVVTNPSNSAEDVELPVFRGVSMSSSAGGSNSQKAKDLYFPKPFNDEQVRIVQLLESSDGVVVQGPPGTGKTHTIANVICHYLAHGRKVLVTSMKEPALAVLRDQLPSEIRPLAISLLTTEKDGMKQFGHSIEKIAAEVQSIDRKAISREIGHLETTIDNTHAKLARIDRDIGKWAKCNLERIRLDEEELEPEIAAKQVVAGREQFEWIPDGLGISDQFKAQFAHSDLVSLREARRSLAVDIDYLGKSIPNEADFPDAGALLRVHQDLSQSIVLKRKLDEGTVPHLANSSDEHLALAQELLITVETIKSLRTQVDSKRLAWTVSIREKLRAGSHVTPLELLGNLGKELEVALQDRKSFLAKPVGCPAGLELDSELTEAARNLSIGKRPFGLLGIVAKAEQKKTLSKITVLGLPPASDAEWAHVVSYISLQLKLRVLAIRWNTLAPELDLVRVADDDPSAALSAAVAFDVYEMVARLVAAEQIAEKHGALVFPAWSEASRVAIDLAAFELMEKALRHHLTSRRLADVWVVRSKIQRSLDGRDGRITDQLSWFLASTLGSPDVPAERMQAKWTALMAELSRVALLAPHLLVISKVADKIEASGAQKWAKALKQPLTSPVDQLLPDIWQTAWRLRRLATHLESIDAHDELKHLGTERLNSEIALRQAYEALVTKRTWLKLTESATALVRAELQAYLAAIKKIGKGTGKSAGRFRQDARRAAQGAQPAVPCWIMPHYRVSESLPPQLGSFDLVIVDEASQSDLTCLPALLRAKKVLIVGDDKQVSPEGIGLEELKVQGLMNRFLNTQVGTYKPQMAPNRSMYDLFKVVFAKSTTMLKEHFRCVGPIIEYSKREVYNHELRPLRIPKASERLDPPLVDVLIEDGYRFGDINKPEADYIVGEIKALVDDPAMEQRSIGVVSLLADKQALHIWKQLTDRIGPEAMSRHQIACGDARTFQGKERDIMFLSMVCAPNDLGASLTRQTFEQRFNVAASRARDRMYLVRSIELAQLSPADSLRRGLISHFTSPFAQDEERVEDLRKLCESDFERDVYDDLTTRGYRVTPQVRVGGHRLYRIDLVVEGERDARLAVECDGDKYHGPDKWDDDMQRQRILERAGWTFWRCFASAYVRRRSAVLADLLCKLKEQGIEPTSGGNLPRSRLSELRRIRKSDPPPSDPPPSDPPPSDPPPSDPAAGDAPANHGVEGNGANQVPTSDDPPVNLGRVKTSGPADASSAARRAGALHAWSDPEFRAGGSARAKKAAETRARRAMEKKQDQSGLNFGDPADRSDS